MLGSKTKRDMERQLRKQIEALNTQLAELSQQGEEALEDGYEQVKSRAGELWQGSREHLLEGYQQLQEQGKAAGQQVSRCVREHPLGSLAIGIGACALICWLIRR